MDQLIQLQVQIIYRMHLPQNPPKNRPNTDDIDDDYDILEPLQITQIVGQKLRSAIQRPDLTDKIVKIQSKLLHRLTSLVQQQGKRNSKTKMDLLSAVETHILTIQRHIKFVERHFDTLANLGGEVVGNVGNGGKKGSGGNLEKIEVEDEVLGELVLSKEQESREDSKKESKKDSPEVVGKRAKKKGKSKSKPKQDSLNNRALEELQIKVRMAQRYYQEGNYRQAIKLFSEIHTMDPDRLNTSELYNYARSLFLLNKKEQAVTIYRKVWKHLEEEPPESEEQLLDRKKTVASYIIECLKKRKNPNLLVSFIPKNIKLYDENNVTEDEEKNQLASDYGLLAWAQQQLRKVPNSYIIKNYEKSIKYKPCDDTYANLAEFYFQIGSYKQCIYNYKQALSMSTNIERFWREQLIKSYFHEKMYIQAKQEFLNLDRPSVQMIELEIQIQTVFGDDAEIEDLNKKLSKLRKEGPFAHNK